MKKPNSLTLVTLLLFCTIGLSATAQFNTIKYVSHGYFTGMDFSDKKMVETHVVITIDQNNVKILEVDLSNPDNDKVIFERRTLSALKYPTLDGDEYYVWKLGDRKMILRKREGVRYLSLYQTDEYGLPREYTTYKITE